MVEEEVWVVRVEMAEDVWVEVEDVVSVSVEESFVAAEVVEVLELVTFAVVDGFGAGVAALTTSLARSRFSKAMVACQWKFGEGGKGWKRG